MQDALKTKTETWACGCEREYVECSDEWINYCGDYCEFAERLIEREYRERYRPAGPTSKGGYPRHNYEYDKLLELHRSKQDLKVTFD